ncbi:hypothetical protein [Hymenobacter chitinivorans]|uniref:Uncharacterized protein n=1 Tax=Hymenobacter chitinivorans DSM 11115 TaxID=1121954 RepID=A0A2M9B5N9_9BACT|nr:hypothetical protein [Hymenobacter chitinivorans]PJJ53263.1 hypothetical protein CLV45_3923 [Hymenobacter chitinivorans DSM 11115]
MPTALRPFSPHELPPGVAFVLALALLGGLSLGNHYGINVCLLFGPVLIPVAVWLVAFSRAPEPLVKALLSATLISLYDVSIKLYGAGSHDDEGQGLFHFLLLLGILPAFLLLVAALDQQQSGTRWRRRLAKLLFLSLLFAHLELTPNLGLGRCINCH